MTTARALFTSYHLLDAISNGVNLVLYKGTNVEEIMKHVFFGTDMEKAKRAQ